MNGNPRDVSFIEAVFRRPKMYTIDGSFEELIAFLEGYYSGMAKNQNAMPLNVWGEFQTWLSTRHNIQSSEIFKSIRDEHCDDRVRAENFLIALKEFSGHRR